MGGRLGSALSNSSASRTALGSSRSTRRRKLLENGRARIASLLPWPQPILSPDRLCTASGSCASEERATSQSQPHKDARDCGPSTRLGVYVRLRRLRKLRAAHHDHLLSRRYVRTIQSSI